MPAKQRKTLEKNADFDVLSEDPESTSLIIKEVLEDKGFSDVVINKQAGIGEIISTHYEIIVDDETIAFIYEPLACHSYNIININNSFIKIATIDTMLSFYLAFIYADRPYYDTERILCMAQYLFMVQTKNRLKQKGLLKRFSIDCYGHQPSLEEIRGKKTSKYR